MKIGASAETKCSRCPDDLFARIVTLCACRLETSDLAIRTISESVGYGDVYSFCKAFRKMVNCAPTEYRKRTK